MSTWRDRSAGTRALTMFTADWSSQCEVVGPDHKPLVLCPCKNLAAVSCSGVSGSQQAGVAESVLHHLVATQSPPLDADVMNCDRLSGWPFLRCEKKPAFARMGISSGCRLLSSSSSVSQPGKLGRRPGKLGRRSGKLGCFQVN